MVTRLVLAAAVLLPSLDLCSALNVLVVGGSGRVGGSTVRWLKTLSDRRQDPISITVGCRTEGKSNHNLAPPAMLLSRCDNVTCRVFSESYRAAINNKVIPSRDVGFLSIDIDGEELSLESALKRWKASGDDHLVVHTAGPFQGRRNPTLLSSCLDLSIPYVDVCDEVRHLV